MHIRFAVPGDANALLAIYAHYVTHSVATFETEAPSTEEFTARIRHIQEGGFPYLVLEDAGKLVGYCYASSFAERAAYRPAVDLSLYLTAFCHRRHAGLALYTCVLRLLAAQGFENAYGVVTASNAPSCALHEHMGFRLAGRMEKVGYKFGTWQDVCYYERFLGEHPQPRRAIVPVSALDASFTETAMRECERMIRPRVCD